MLKLSFNKLSDNGAIALAVSLSTHRSLTYFGVLHNNIGNLGAIKLVHSLKNCRNLYFLDMQCNEISYHGVKEISAVLKATLPKTDLKIWNKNLDFPNCDIDIPHNKNSLTLKHCCLSMVMNYLPEMLSNKLQVLDMKGNRLYGEELGKIFPFLSLCKNLEELMLGYNILGSGTSYDTNTSLEESFHSLFLNCSKISHLDMSFNDLICDDLNFQKVGLSNLRMLEYIDLSGNYKFIEYWQAEEISLCVNLHTILLNECDLKLPEVVQILRKCKKLKRIGLARNNRITSSTSYVSDCLICLPELRILNLSSNSGIGSHIFDLNSSVLESMFLLEELVISACSINEQGYAFLSIMNWNNLHTLVIRFNSIGCADIASFTLGMKYFITHLETLDISHNKINDEGLLCVCDALVHDRCSVIGSDDTNSKCLESSLRTLNISNNQISDVGIPFFTKICTKLVSLNISCNKISLSGIVLLKERCSHFKVLKYEEQKT